MLVAHAPSFQVPGALAAVVVAGMLIMLFSLIEEPARQQFGLG
jgi:hypothetical protein